jgi:hypothetical protein
MSWVAFAAVNLAILARLAGEAGDPRWRVAIGVGFAQLGLFDFFAYLGYRHLKALLALPVGPARAPGCMLFAGLMTCYFFIMLALFGLIVVWIR